MKPTLLTTGNLLIFLVLIAVGLLIFYQYIYRQEARQARRLTGRQTFLLWFLRAVVAIMAIVALARPAVNLIDLQVRRPVVAFLVDESSSMNFPTVPGDTLTAGNTKEYRTRYDSAQGAVQKLQEKLTLTHKVRVYSFSDKLNLLKELRDRDRASDPIEARSEVFDPKRRATGDYTNLGDAIQDLLHELATDQNRVIILLSDGRQTGGRTSIADVAKRAADVAIPVYTVAQGTEWPLRDLRIDEVVAPEEVSRGDVLTFRVRITNQISEGLETKLTLEEEGQFSAGKTIVLRRGENNVSIATIPEKEGLRQFRLKLPEFPDEVNLENNQAVKNVKVVKRTLRVLLIAGKPSREYLYLVPALLRDPVINVSTYLQSADVDYIHQGNTSIDRLPTTTVEWQPYDVCILQDVDPNKITTPQINGLEEMVNKGGGLVFIAGRNHGLAKLVQVHAARIRGLLPVEIDKNLYPDYDAFYETPFKTRRTGSGKGHPIMLASSDDKLNEELWATFPAFYWFHPVQSAKPNAITLLEHDGPGEAAGTPLMVIQRYNEGAVFFTALDAFWLWRYPYESYDYDRFWTRTIRYLGETRLRGSQQQVSLGTDRPSYSPGEKVRITLRIADPALVAQLRGQSVFVAVTSPQGAKHMVQLKPRQDNPSFYDGDYVAKGNGSMLVEAKQIAPEAESDQKPLFVARCGFDVRMQSLEDKDTSADLATLAMLAAKTSAASFDYKSIDKLTDMVKSISTTPQQLTRTIQVEVWDGVPFLILFLILISGEWSLRKLWGLL